MPAGICLSVSPSPCLTHALSPTLSLFPCAPHTFETHRHRHRHRHARTHTHTQAHTHMTHTHGTRTRTHTHTHTHPHTHRHGHGHDTHTQTHTHTQRGSAQFTTDTVGRERQRGKQTERDEEGRRSHTPTADMGQISLCASNQKRMCTIRDSLIPPHGPEH